MINYDSVCEEVNSLLTKVLNLQPEKINESSRLVDISTDSIQLFELLIAFENAYNFEVKYEDAVSLNTVKDIIDYVYKLKLETVPQEIN